MFVWTIEGADKITGEERVVSVEAATEEEAIIAGGKKGLLVSSARQRGVANEAPELPPAPRRVWVPDYVGITKGATLLHSTADFYGILQWACIVLAIAAVIVAIVLTGLGRSEPVPAIAGAAVLALGLLILSSIFRTAKIFLRLRADLALAQRDAARNSFRD